MMGAIGRATVYWAGTAACLFVASYIISGVHYESVQALLVASLVLAVLNSVFRPVLILVSLPIVVLTFGLFLILLNSVLLGLTAWVVEGFYVEGMISAILASIIISIVSLFLGLNKKGSTTEKQPPKKINKNARKNPGVRHQRDEDVIDI